MRFLAPGRLKNGMSRNARGSHVFALSFPALLLLAGTCLAQAATTNAPLFDLSDKRRQAGTWVKTKITDDFKGRLQEDMRTRLIEDTPEAVSVFTFETDSCKLG